MFDSSEGPERTVPSGGRRLTSDSRIIDLTLTAQHSNLPLSLSLRSFLKLVKQSGRVLDKSSSTEASVFYLSLSFSYSVSIILPSSVRRLLSPRRHTLSGLIAACSPSTSPLLAFRRDFMPSPHLNRHFLKMMDTPHVLDSHFL